MATDHWTQLVKKVDRLILELREARQEAKKWRTRAVEMERLKVKDERTDTLSTQARERELDRLRKDRKKTIVLITKQIQELENAQIQVMETRKNE